MTARETVDARKQPLAPAAALALARSMDRIVSIKGKTVRTLNLEHNQPDDEALLALLLGPTGNLRAPALRRGRTLIVGFSADFYREVFAVTDNR